MAWRIENKATGGKSHIGYDNYTGTWAIVDRNNKRGPWNVKVGRGIDILHESTDHKTANAAKDAAKEVVNA